jgi:hypothetical protein
MTWSACNKVPIESLLTHLNFIIYNVKLSSGILSKETITASKIAYFLKLIYVRNWALLHSKHVSRVRGGGSAYGTHQHTHVPSSLTASDLNKTNSAVRIHELEIHRPLSRALCALMNLPSFGFEQDDLAPITVAERSWVPIPLKAWIFVCNYSVFVLSYVRSGLPTGWSPVQGVLPTVLKLRTWSETKRFTVVLCSKVGVTGKRERTWFSIILSRVRGIRDENDGF